MLDLGSEYSHLIAYNLTLMQFCLIEVRLDPWCKFTALWSENLSIGDSSWLQRRSKHNPWSPTPKMAGASVVLVPTHINPFPLRDRSKWELLIPETGSWPWKEEAGVLYWTAILKWKHLIQKAFFQLLTLLVKSTF